MANSVEKTNIKCKCGEYMHCDYTLTLLTSPVKYKLFCKTCHSFEFDSVENIEKRGILDMLKTITVDGKEYQINSELLEKLISKEEIKSEAVEEVKLTGWERVERRSDYYYFDENFLITSDIDNGDVYSNKAFSINNYFSTEGKAEKMTDRIKLLLAISKWRDENDKRYNGESYGYLIIVDTDEKLISIDSIDACGVLDTMFTTKELADEALRVFEKQIKEIWGI